MNPQRHTPTPEQIEAAERLLKAQAEARSRGMKDMVLKDPYRVLINHPDLPTGVSTLPVYNHTELAIFKELNNLWAAMAELTEPNAQTQHPPLQAPQISVAAHNRLDEAYAAYRVAQNNPDSWHKWSEATHKLMAQLDADGHVGYQQASTKQP